MSMNAAPSNKLRPQDWLLLLVAAGVCSGLLLFATSRYGAGVSPDSVGYIAVARNLLAGVGFTNFDGAPFLVQPPLYPLLLAAVAGIFGTDPLSAAAPLNALLSGVIVLLTGILLLRMFPRQRWLALVGLGALAGSLPLIEVGMMAWSEPLFICLLAAHLLLVDHYFDRPGWRALIAISLSVALVVLTRYIGVILVPVFLAALCVLRTPAPRQRLAQACAFIAMVGLPLGFWVARNWHISGTLFGPRNPGTRGLGENAALAFERVVRWFAPPSPVPRLLLGGVVAVLIAVTAWQIWHRCRGGEKPIRSAKATAYAAWLCLAYVAFLVITSTTTAYDEINDRLVSPVIVVLVPCALFALQQSFAMLRRSMPGKAVLVLLGAACIAALVYQVRWTGKLAIFYHFDGYGLTSKAWLTSPTLRYLEQVGLPDCVPVSNGADALYVLTGIHALPAPVRGQPLAGVLERVGDLRIEHTGARACIIWFHQLSFRTYLEPLQTLLEQGTVSEIIEKPDGVIAVIDVN